MAAKKILLAISFFFLCPMAHSQTQTSYTASPSIMTEIEEWESCYDVLNNATRGLFIPTKTANEYDSFVDNHPVIVSVNQCIPDPPVIASWKKSMGSVPATTCAANVVIRTEVDWLASPATYKIYDNNNNALKKQGTFTGPFDTPGFAYTKAMVCDPPANPADYIITSGVTFASSSTVIQKPDCSNNFFGKYRFTHGCGGSWGDPMNTTFSFRIAPKVYNITAAANCTQFTPAPNVVSLTVITGKYYCTTPGVLPNCAKDPDGAGGPLKAPSTKSYGSYNAGICRKNPLPCLTGWTLNQATGVCTHP